jgi:hypothetical protein
VCYSRVGGVWEGAKQLEEGAVEWASRGPDMETMEFSKTRPMLEMLCMRSVNWTSIGADDIYIPYSIDILVTGSPRAIGLAAIPYPTSAFPMT